jgi:hypothetical protein
VFVDLQNKEYRKKLYDMYGDFRIARHHPKDFKHTIEHDVYENGRLVKEGSFKTVEPWIYTTTEQAEDQHYNHRDILPGEIVWECDSTVVLDNVVAGLIIYNRLLNDGIIAQAWLSGNKSLHVSALFYTHNIKDLMAFRTFVFNKYVGDIKADRALLGKHLIRAEYGVHEKTGCYKGLLVGPVEPIKNHIPEDLMSDFDDELFRIEYNKYKDSIKRNTGIYRNRMPKCTGVLLSDEYYAKNDGVNRGLFAISNIYAHNIEDKQKGYELLTKWNSKLKKPFGESTLLYHFRKALNTPQSVSCRYLHNLYDELGLSYKCESLKVPTNVKK